MDNKIKKYLDRVVMELVNGTEIDYDKERISFPHHRLFSPILPFSPTFGLTLIHPFTTSFLYGLSNYCKNTFGLTKEEIGYVWEEYRSIILDKIKDGQ